MSRKIKKVSQNIHRNLIDEADDTDIYGFVCFEDYGWWNVFVGTVFPHWFIDQIRAVHSRFDVLDPNRCVPAGEYYEKTAKGRAEVRQFAKSLDSSLVAILERKNAQVIGYLFSQNDNEVCTQFWATFLRFYSVLRLYE